MASLKMSRRGVRIAILGLVLVLGIASSATPALAGGHVLPPNAKPHGYSLSDMLHQAALLFSSGNDPTHYPQTPIQILYIPAGYDPMLDGPLVFPVRPGTMLYVPLFTSDDSPIVIGDFPDVRNQAAVADYYFSPDELGITIAEIQVDDGAVTTLGRGYAAGVETPPLLDGGGTHLTALAAFINPLNKGLHKVTIRVWATGEAWRLYPPNGGVLPPVFVFSYCLNVH